VPGTNPSALQKIGATSHIPVLGKAAYMLEFICSTCGQFSFDDEVCAVCTSSTTDELAA